MKAQNQGTPPPPEVWTSGSSECEGPGVLSASWWMQSKWKLSFWCIFILNHLLYNPALCSSLENKDFASLGVFRTDPSKPAKGFSSFLTSMWSLTPGGPGSLTLRLQFIHVPDKSILSSKGAFYSSGVGVAFGSTEGSSVGKVMPQEGITSCLWPCRADPHTGISSAPPFGVSQPAAHAPWFLNLYIHRLVGVPPLREQLSMAADPVLGTVQRWEGGPASRPPTPREENWAPVAPVLAQTRTGHLLPGVEKASRHFSHRLCTYPSFPSPPRQAPHACRPCKVKRSALYLPHVGVKQAASCEGLKCQWVT